MIDLQVGPVLGAAEEGAATLGRASGTVSISAAGKITFGGAGLNDASLAEILAAVRSVVTGAGEIAFFEFDDGVNGSGTFLYQENGASTDDILIFMPGVANAVDFSTTFGDANTFWIA
jgi:hypothetical protein